MSEAFLLLIFLLFSFICKFTRFFSSRQPSGIVSPSEIPDSPSQSMPQSPHYKRRAVPTYPRVQPIGSSVQLPYYDDEVKTFYVENTPAHISCATSISNLSFDDEPKDIDDLPTPNLAPPVQPRSSQMQSRNPEASSTVARDEKTVDRTNDSDDSSDDDEIDSQLLENCINAGIKATTRPKIVGAGTFANLFSRSIKILLIRIYFVRFLST